MSNIYNVINWGLLGEGKPPSISVPLNRDSYLVMEYYCDNWGHDWPPNYTNIFFSKNLAGAFSKVIELTRNHVDPQEEFDNNEYIVNQEGVYLIEYWNSIDMDARLNNVKKGLRPYDFNHTPNSFLEGWRQVFDYQLLSNENYTYELYIFYKPKDGV